MNQLLVTACLIAAVLGIYSATVGTGGTDSKIKANITTHGTSANTSISSLNP